MTIMSTETHIPILRLGEEYRSLDTVELEASAGNAVYTHTANPGLIRRDILDLDKSKAALEAFPADTLAGYCEAAAELFLHEELTSRVIVEDLGDIQAVLPQKVRYRQEELIILTLHRIVNPDKRRMPLSL